MGNLFIRRLADGFHGRLFAINPGEREVAGLAAVTSAADLPDGIDVLIALVPAANVLGMVESCTVGQTRYLLAIPSGFGEASPQGRELELRLVAAAQARG